MPFWIGNTTQAGCYNSEALLLLKPISRQLAQEQKRDGCHFLYVFMTTTTTKPDKQYDSSNPDIRLKDILKTLPRECFQQDRRKAWSRALTSAYGWFGLHGHCHRSWFLLPLVWILPQH